MTTTLRTTLPSPPPASDEVYTYPPDPPLDEVAADAREIRRILTKYAYPSPSHPQGRTKILLLHPTSVAELNRRGYLEIFDIEAIMYERPNIRDLLA
jgi:hypothetical protein